MPEVVLYDLDWHTRVAGPAVEARESSMRVP